MIKVDCVKEVKNNYNNYSYYASSSSYEHVPQIPIFIQANISKLTGKMLYYKVVKELAMTQQLREHIDNCFAALERGEKPCFEKDKQKNQVDLPVQESKKVKFISNNTNCSEELSSIDNANECKDCDCCDFDKQNDSCFSFGQAKDVNVSNNSCNVCPSQKEIDNIDMNTLNADHKPKAIDEDQKQDSRKSAELDSTDLIKTNETEKHADSETAQNGSSDALNKDCLYNNFTFLSSDEDSDLDHQEDYGDINTDNTIDNKEDESDNQDINVVVPFVLVVSFESGSYWSSNKREVIIPFDDSIAIQPNCNEKFSVSLRWNKNENNENGIIPLNDTSSLPTHPRSEHENQSNSVLTLDDCLAKFSEPVILDKNDMWYCPKCKEHRCAQLRQQVWKCPRYLIIALKRFVYRGAYRAKNTEFVDYPEYLSVSSKEGGTSNYRFYAVSRHHGSLGGGHYTAIARQGERWVDFNDSSATVLPSPPSPDASAYVLFYEKVDTLPISSEVSNIPTQNLDTSSVDATTNNNLDENNV